MTTRAPQDRILDDNISGSVKRDARYLIIDEVKILNENVRGSVAVNTVMRGAS